MKIITSKFSLLLITVLLISSCGTGKFTGKHYRNRSWIKVDPIAQQKENGNENQKEVAENSTVIVSNPELKSEEKSTTQSENFVSKSQADLTSKPFNQSKKSESPDQISESVLESNSNTVVLDENQAENKKVMNKDITHDSDLMLIIEIILAFILPPLAIFLHDGATSGLFWVTLILCLFAFGGGWWIFGGLFGLWGISTILALLRIFDII